MKDFLNRFETIPDLIELDHLTVSGDVTFGKGVSLKVGRHIWKDGLHNVCHVVKFKCQSVQIFPKSLSQPIVNSIVARQTLEWI